MKKITLVFFSLCVFQLYAQEDNSTTETKQDKNTEKKFTPSKVKRFSLGAKIGVPNIIGGSVEGITPLLKNRVSLFIDYSRINPKVFIEVGGTERRSNDKIVIQYFEIGSNFYFTKPGNGIYAGIGYGSLNVDVNIEGVNFDVSGMKGVGSGSGNIKINTTNLKMGIKTGGTIYFRAELGYGFGSIPKDVNVEGTFTYTAPGGTTLTVNGTAIEKFPEIPTINANGFIIGNIGFGISF